MAQHRVAEAYGEGEDGVWHKGDGEEGAHHSALVGVSGVGRFAGGARSFELRQIPQSKKASAGPKAVNCQRYVRVPPTQHPRATATKGAVFSERAFFLRTCPARPIRVRYVEYEVTSSHMFRHHPATVRLAGRKRHARLESSEPLAELPAVARTAVELHGCCARVSLAAAQAPQPTH